MDPVIEWYEAPEAPQPVGACDYGVVDAGARSPAKRLFLYNNKGGNGASTATDLRYSTFDDAGGGEAGDVVAGRWLEVRLVSADGEPATDPDGGFRAVGGADPAHQKDLSGFPLENGAYLELETRVAVPPSPAAGRRDFVQRIEFKFT